MGSTMKVHHFTRGIWEHESTALSLGCKRLRSLAPKLDDSTISASGGFDIKSFIRADYGPKKTPCFDEKRDTSQVEVTMSGTRWNPTQEQIGILEMLYSGGMRTPNAQQIEQITLQLGKFGKIEGKNVFYWFQNHKARERQKQKRNGFGTNLSPRNFATSIATSITLNARLQGEEEKEEDIQCKRKCMSWTFNCCDDDEWVSNSGENRTLELFPLHPEGR